MPRPSLFPEWASGGSGSVEPSSAKKLLGWIVEKPPYQFFNWWMNLVYLWLVQLASESTANAAAIAAETIRATAAETTSSNRILLGFDAIVGSSADATHSTIALAVAALTTGGRILVTSNQTLNTTVTLSSAKTEIVIKDNVTVSNGSAGTGFSVASNLCTIRGGTVSGFTTAVNVTSGGTRAKIRDIYFTGNTTDVNDSSDLASIVGCIN